MEASFAWLPSGAHKFLDNKVRCSLYFGRPLWPCAGSVLQVVRAHRGSQQLLLETGTRGAPTCGREELPRVWGRAGVQCQGSEKHKTWGRGQMLLTHAPQTSSFKPQLRRTLLLGTIPGPTLPGPERLGYAVHPRTMVDTQDR